MIPPYLKPCETPTCEGTTVLHKPLCRRCHRARLRAQRDAERETVHIAHSEPTFARDRRDTAELAGRLGLPFAFAGPDGVPVLVRSLTELIASGHADRP